MRTVLTGIVGGAAALVAGVAASARAAAMRVGGAALVASIAAVAAWLGGVLTPPQSAQAQVPEAPAARFQVTEAAKKTGTPGAKKGAPAPVAKKGAPAPQAAPNAYANVPLAERVGIQFDLAFTGYYNGLITGEFNDRALAAVRAFQKDAAFRETGVLAPPERVALAARSKAKQEQVGWRMVDDRRTGAQLGLPTAQVPNVSQGRSGTRWSSAQGQVQIETFRVREPGATLATVFEQQKKEPPGRKLEQNFIRNDVFILSGTQGLKKFYVRAQVKDLEVRGMTVLWDPATEGIMDPVVVAMSSAFAPFPGTGISALLGPPPRRKVEYGTGIVVSAGGHILADRQVTDACNVIQISGHGDADLIADDAAAGLALLRVYGAPDLVPAALAQEGAQDGARGGDLSLVGIADPQAQAGGHAVSTVAARFNGDALQPVPQLGFAGAAALDGQGRVAGMVALKTPAVASASTNTMPPPQGTVVSIETIRKFLDTHSVTPATGRSGIDAAKASLVRVICVRR
jgi:peptidoglycan hydrolase-like protein with peptidoglycan-binding domain